ncbi:DUF6393 family protein [Xanthomonas arboricola]|nr:DUF6393 family protein [Xanthomonas arboricola]
MKTKASQTRQIVSTTSLRDAVWNSEANTALSTAHVKHQSRQSGYLKRLGLATSSNASRSVVAYLKRRGLQEYLNAYIWMWHKMDRLGSPDDPTQLFINHGKLVVRWYRLHGRSVDVPACLGRLRTARTFYSSDWLYQEIAMPRIVLNGWAATLALTGLAVLPLSSCANADTARTASTQEDTMKSGASPMLEEIYASKKPVRFEQVDVSSIVSKYVPLGTTKLVVLETFSKSPTSKIVEDTPGKVVVRDNKGQAMLDPDARSIVMTFSLDADGKVTHVDAVHIKNQ